MEIECGTFKLRPLRMEDKNSLATYANNINIWKNVRDSFPHPYSVDDAVRFIELNQTIFPATSFCIDFNAECIGMIGYVPQGDVYRKTAEFGYWLGEPFWGKGIMTTAAKKLTAYIFEHFDIVRLYAGVFEWNKASMKVLEKTGFKFDCIFEKSIFKNGQIINEHRYSLLKPDI